MCLNLHKLFFKENTKHIDYQRKVLKELITKISKYEGILNRMIKINVVYFKESR